MLANELRDDVREHEDPDVDRGRDAHDAVRARARLAHRRVRLVQPVEREARALKVVAPRVGETELWCSWAERVLMWPTARYVTAVNDDKLGAAFHADRAAMRGHAAPGAAELAASIPHHREQCRLMLGWLDEILSTKPFLLGDTPGLADFAVYQRIWWLGAFGGRARDVLADLGQVGAWADRIHRIGHGTRSEMTPADALAIARAAAPIPAKPIAAGVTPSAGERITVGTEGFAPDAVSGVVVAADQRTISIAHGGVVVHFPRTGYEWRGI